MRQQTTRLWTFAGLALSLALAAAALAGCYVSGGLLLDAEAAAYPLEDGVYTRPGGTDRWRVQRELDGWYDVEPYNASGSIGETKHVLINELPLGTMDAYAIAEETDDGYVYAVLIKAKDGFYLVAPDCADPLDADTAVDNNGQPEDADSPTHNCTFKTHDDLDAALAGYAGHADFGAAYTLEGGKPR